MTNPNQHDVEASGMPSASGMERFVNCPGSWAIEQLCPSVAAAEVTLDGTAVAKALETGDDSILTYTQEDIKKSLDDLEARIVADWAKDINSEVSIIGAPIREERSWIRDRHTLQPIASAKPDVAYADQWNKPTCILSIDHKSGFLDPTDAPSNWQLRTQAVALWHEYPSVQEIRVAWCRARLGQNYSQCTYGLQDLRHAEQELMHAFWVAKQDDAPRRPGKWCNYCRAKAFCHEAQAFAVIPSVKVGMPVSKQDAIAKVALLAPSQLVAVQRQASTIRNVLDAVSDRMKALPESELKELGYKLRKDAVMDITKPMDAFNHLYAIGLFENREEFERCLALPMGAVTDPAMLKKLAKAKDCTQKEAKDAIREALKDVSETTEKVVLVPIKE